MLSPHNPSWAGQFVDESSLAIAALGDVLIELHHIGSTAIPGIVAKPVIDMLAVVTSVDALDSSSPHLATLGYEALGEFGIPGRRYFRKDSAAGVRTHQLHAFAIGSDHIERHLGFRDYLRAHSGQAHAYELLKKVLAERYAGDMGAYSHGKTDFIREIERRASGRPATG